MKIEPNETELKTANINARVRPSVEEGVLEMCEDLNYSKSALVDLILEQAILEHRKNFKKKRR